MDLNHLLEKWDSPAGGRYDMELDAAADFVKWLVTSEGWRIVKLRHAEVWCDDESSDFYKTILPYYSIEKEL